MTHPTSASKAPRARTSRKRWVRSAAVAALAAMLLALAAAFAGTALAKDDEEDLSLYAVGSAVTSYFASAIKPDSDVKVSDSWKAIMGSPSTGGAVVGYADKDLNPIEWLIAQATSSSQAIEYDTLSSLSPGTRQYAEFGATLSGLGIDSTSTGLSTNFLAFIGGGILYIGVVMAGFIDVLFGMALQLMVWLNPFQWFFNAINKTNSGLAEGMVGGELSESATFFSGLASYVSGIYSTVTALSWAVIVPLFIATAFLFLLLGKAKGGTLRKLGIRLIFIGIGVPLLGSMYTGALNSLSDNLDGGSSGVARVVASTFVDFEGWMTESRLAVPARATIEWDRSTNAPTVDATANVQDTARAINVMVHDEFAELGSILNAGDEISWSPPKTDVSDTGKESSARGAALDILGRYMRGEGVSSSAFAGSIQGSLTGEDAPKGAADWFKDLRDDDMPKKVSENPLLRISDGLTATVVDSTVTFSSSAESRKASCAASTSATCSMSVLSAYNYLNTTFGATSMKVYSPNKVSSAAVQEVHDSVTLVGSGVSAFIYWFSALVLIASFIVIGFAYALMLTIGNVIKGIKVLTAVPFAMMGALGAITKVIVFTFTMIVEAFATIFVYQLVQELLLGLPRIFNNATMAVLNFLKLGDTFIWLPQMNLGMNLVMSLLVIMFTVAALRVRGSVVTALSDVSTKIVEKVIGGGGEGGSGGSGMVGAVAGGVAAGAGSAAMRNHLSNKSDGGTATAESDGGAVSTVSADGPADGDGPKSNPGDEPSPQPGGSGGNMSTGSGAGGTSSSRSTNSSRSSESSDAELGGKVAVQGLTMSPTSQNLDAPKGKGASKGGKPSGAGGPSGATKSVGAGAAAAGAGQGAGGVTNIVVGAGSAVSGGSNGSPGARGEAGADGDTGAGGTSRTSRGAAPDGDPIDSMYEAGEADYDKRKELDKRTAQAATGMVGAGVLAGRGAARAAAGDELGAASDLSQAAGKAQTSAQGAKAAQQERRELNDPGKVGTSGQGQSASAGGVSSGAAGGRSSAPSNRPKESGSGRGPRPAPERPAPQRGGSGAGRPPQRVASSKGQAQPSGSGRTQGAPPRPASSQQPSTSRQQPRPASRQQPSTSRQQPRPASRQQPSTSRQQPRPASRQQPSTSRQQPRPASRQQPSAAPRSAEQGSWSSDAGTRPVNKRTLPVEGSGGEGNI